MSSRVILNNRAVYSKGETRPPEPSQRMHTETKFINTKFGVIPMGAYKPKPADLSDVQTDGGDQVFPPEHLKPFRQGEVVYDIDDNLHFHQLTAAQMPARDSWAPAEFWLERWKGSRYQDLLLLCEAGLIVPGKLVGSGLKRFKCKHEGAIVAHVAEFTRRRPGNEPSAVVHCTMAEQWAYRAKIKRDNELRDAKLKKQSAFAERILGKK